MAAVLALVMVPLLAAIGFFSGATHAEGTFAGAFATGTFFALGALVLFGALRMIRGLEEPQH
jgi:hypothetical protein